MKLKDFSIQGIKNLLKNYGDGGKYIIRLKDCYTWYNFCSFTDLYGVSSILIKELDCELQPTFNSCGDYYIDLDDTDNIDNEITRFFDMDLYIYKLNECEIKIDKAYLNEDKNNNLLPTADKIAKKLNEDKNNNLLPTADKIAKKLNENELEHPLPDFEEYVKN